MSDMEEYITEEELAKWHKIWGNAFEVVLYSQYFEKQLPMELLLKLERLRYALGEIDDPQTESSRDVKFDVEDRWSGY